MRQVRTLGYRKVVEDPKYSDETIAEIVGVVCLYFHRGFSFCSLGHIELASSIG